MVSVVRSNPTGGNFIFLRHLDANFVQKCQKCQICVIYENLMYLFITASRCAFGATGDSKQGTIKTSSSPITFPYVHLNTCGGYDAKTGKQNHVFIGGYDAKTGKQNHVFIGGYDAKTGKQNHVFQKYM